MLPGKAGYNASCPRESVNRGKFTSKAIRVRHCRRCPTATGVSDPLQQVQPMSWLSVCVSTCLTLPPAPQPSSSCTTFQLGHVKADGASPVNLTLPASAPVIAMIRS